MGFERLDEPFVLKHADFKSWRCVKFGFDRAWIRVHSTAALADKFLDSISDSEELLLALDLSKLGATDENKAKELLEKLCAIETRKSIADSECWKLWLSLGLLWLCEHQRFIRDPLEIAENFVDDLSIVLQYRPREATTWLRYMPADPKEWNPAHHSNQQNYERLMSEWKAFLKRYADKHLKGYREIISGCS